MFRRIGILLTWILVALPCSASPLFADEARQGIVVWRIEKKQGVSEEEIDSISGFVASEVERHSGGKVISESDIETIFKGEEKKQQCGADSSSCLAEIGAALGVPEVVAGDLGRVGNFWFLNLKRIDVRNATVIKRASRNVEGDINVLIRVLPGAVAELFGKEIARANMGRLSLISDPAGAAVTLDGKTVGSTPFEAELPAGGHTLVVELEGFENTERSVTVEKEKKVDVSVTLQPVVYPMNPYKKYGYVTFFSGVGLCAFGGIAAWQASEKGADFEAGDRSAKDASDGWEGAMIASFAVGGAAMVTGVVLWALSPGDEAWAKKQQVSISPVTNGNDIGIMLSGRW